MFDTSLSSLRALRRLVRAALVPAVVAGCTPTGPSESLPTGAVPLAAPAVYRDWFARTESCSGLSGSLDQVQVLVLPRLATFETHAAPKGALCRRRGGQHYIVIAGAYLQH